MECLKVLILFNLFHSDLFFILTDIGIASDADVLPFIKHVAMLMLL